VYSRTRRLSRAGRRRRRTDTESHRYPLGRRPVCGENGNVGSVEFRASDAEIVVAGQTLCDDLRPSVFDTADGSEAIVELTVVRGDDCEECRSEIPFEATIPFPDVYPTEIELVYDTLDGSESITTARRG
jgi:hypothetical protein